MKAKLPNVVLCVIGIALAGSARATDYGESVVISSAADLPTDGVFDVTTEDATVTVDVGIDDGGTPVAVVKRGAGRLVLNAANSFTGGLTVEEGHVIVNHAEALGRGSVTYRGTRFRQVFLNVADATFTNDFWFVSGVRRSDVEGDLAFGESCTLAGRIRSREDASGEFAVGGQGRTATGNADLFSGNVRFSQPIDFSPSVQFRLVTYGTMSFDGRISAPNCSLSAAASAGGTVWLNATGNNLGDGECVLTYNGYIRCGAENALAGFYWKPYCYTANKFRLSLDLNGWNQTLRAIGYEAVLPMHEHADERNWTVICSDRTAYMTIAGRESGQTDLLYHGFADKAGLVLDADPGYALVQTNRLNTTSADLIISNGVFRMVGRDAFANVPSVYVGEGGRLECETDQAQAFAACRTLTVYGVFSCPANELMPFAQDAIDVILGPVAELHLPEGSELRVNTLSVVDSDGQVTVMPAGRYAAASGFAQVKSGTVFALPKEETSATWTGAGGTSASVGSASNWSTSPQLPDLDFFSLVATFASGGASALVDRPLGVAGIVLDAPTDFTLAAGGDHPVRVGAKGVAVRGGAHHYGIEPRLEALTDDDWVLDMPSGATLSLRGGARLDGRLRLNSGRLKISGAVEQSCGPSVDPFVTAPANGLCAYCEKDGSHVVLDGATVGKPFYARGRHVPNTDFRGSWLAIGANTTNRFLSGVFLYVPSTIPMKDGSSLEFAGPVNFDGGLTLGTDDMASGHPQVARAHVTFSAAFGSLKSSALSVWGGVTLRLAASASSLNGRFLSLDDGYGKLHSALELAADHAITNMEYILIGHCGRVDFGLTKQYWPKVNTTNQGRCVAETVMTGRLGSELQVADGMIRQKVEGALSLRACGPSGSFFGLTNVVSTSVGDISVDSGTLAFDAGSSWLNGTNVTVRGAGRLEIAQSRTFDKRRAVLRLADDGVLSIPEGVSQMVNALYHEGRKMTPGVYGSLESSASNKSLARHFVGKGCLSVRLGGTVMIVR